MTATPKPIVPTPAAVHALLDAWYPDEDWRRIFAENLDEHIADATAALAAAYAEQFGHCTVAQENVRLRDEMRRSLRLTIFNALTCALENGEDLLHKSPLAIAVELSMYCESLTGTPHTAMLPHIIAWQAENQE